MKDKTKTRLKRLAVLIAVILVMIFVMIAIDILEYYFDRSGFKRAWGFTMPLCKVVYVEDNLGWLGEGTNYSVYKLKEKDAEWAGNLKVKGEALAISTVNSEKQKEMETIFSEIVNKINIKEKYEPNFNEEYNWILFGDTTKDLTITNSKIAIYFPATRILILYASIH